MPNVVANLFGSSPVMPLENHVDIAFLQFVGRVVGRIFASWVVTIPAGAILAIVFFFVFRAVLP